MNYNLHSPQKPTYLIPGYCQGWEPVCADTKYQKHTQKKKAERKQSQDARMRRCCTPKKTLARDRLDLLSIGQVNGHSKCCATIIYGHFLLPCITRKLLVVLLLRPLFPSWQKIKDVAIRQRQTLVFQTRALPLPLSGTREKRDLPTT